MIDSIRDLHSSLYDIIAPMCHHTRWRIECHLSLPKLGCLEIRSSPIEYEGSCIGIMDLAIRRISEEAEELIDFYAFGFSLHSYSVELANSEYISYLRLGAT